MWKEKLWKNFRIFFKFSVCGKPSNLSTAPVNKNPLIFLGETHFST